MRLLTCIGNITPGFVQTIFVQTIAVVAAIVVVVVVVGGGGGMCVCVCVCVCVQRLMYPLLNKGYSLSFGDPCFAFRRVKFFRTLVRYFREMSSSVTSVFRF